MHFFPETRIFLQIGPINIYWYAVLILIGAFACYSLCLHNLKKMGYTSAFAEDLFIGAFASGLIGARIWFCVFYDLGFYLSNPLEFLQVYDGGMAIQGGVIAGALYGAWYAKKHRVDFFRLADGIIPNLLVAQAIGRWGNFINQEAFGGIVDESFYQYFPSFIKNMMFIQGEYRMPTFLFESIGNISMFVLIVFVIKRFVQLKRGDMVYLYCIGYSCVRFFVEGLRTDSLMLGPIRMAQLTSIALICVGIFGLMGGFRKIFKAKKPIILWDLDGTLLDTEPAIIETYRQLFIKYSDESLFDHDKQLEVLGPALKTQFPKYFPGKDVDELIKEYREINYELHKSHVFMMKNTKETLEILKNEGYRMGIVSTKLTEGVKHGLSLYDLESYFEVIIGEDCVSKGKPDPEGLFKACEEMGVSHDDVIYIGDTKTDVAAAKSAGMFSIGYIFNQHRKQMMIDANPNRVIEDLIEVTEIVKEEHGWTTNMM